MTQKLNLLDAVVARLRSVDGVIGVWPVDAADRKMIHRLEEEEGRGTRIAGLVILNEGLGLALEREFLVCINHSSRLRHPSKPILVLMADNDLIGQEVWEEDQLARYQKDANMIFLGKNFVLFRDGLEASKGKPPRFILGPQGFPEIEKIQSVCDVVSASVSISSDTYIKRKAGWRTGDTDSGTVLVGFNSKKT